MTKFGFKNLIIGAMFTETYQKSVIYWIVVKKHTYYIEAMNIENSCIASFYIGDCHYMKKIK